MYRISVLSHNLEKYLKIRNRPYKIQGLEFSHLSEMNNTFKTRLDLVTYKHYIEQPMPMVERLINRKFFKIYELIKTLDDIDLSLHMAADETRKRDTHYNSDEDE